MKRATSVIVLVTATTYSLPLCAARDEARIVEVTAANIRSLGLHLQYFRSNLFIMRMPGSVEGASFTEARLELRTGQRSLTVPVVAESHVDGGAALRIQFWGNRKSLQDCRLLIRYGVAWEAGGTLYVLELRDFVSVELRKAPESY